MITLEGHQHFDGQRYINGNPVSSEDYYSVVKPLHEKKAHWVEKYYNRSTGTWRVVLDESCSDEVSLWEDASEPW